MAAFGAGPGAVTLALAFQLFSPGPVLFAQLLFILLVVLLFLVTQFSVQRIVHAFFDFVADILFGRILRPVLQAVEDITLCIGSAADQQQGRNQ